MDIESMLEDLIDEILDQIQCIFMKDYIILTSSRTTCKFLGNDDVIVNEFQQNICIFNLTINMVEYLYY